MSITKAELLVAAECAEEYPPGCGAHYLGHHGADDAAEAEEMIAADRSLIPSG